SDAAGKVIRAWDLRGHTVRTVYDHARRPIETHMREGAGAELLVLRTDYGENEPDPEAGNLRGEVGRGHGEAGIVTTDAYAFTGNLLHNQRQFAAQYATVLDWAGAVAREPDVYATQTRYDALNRAVEITTPDTSVLRPIYNEANLLEHLEGNLQGAAAI